MFIKVCMTAGYKYVHNLCMKLALWNLKSRLLQWFTVLSTEITEKRHYFWSVLTKAACLIL